MVMVLQQIHSKKLRKLTIEQMGVISKKTSKKGILLV